MCVCVVGERGEQWVTRDSNWLVQGHERSEMNSIGKTHQLGLFPSSPAGL